MTGYRTGKVQTPSFIKATGVALIAAALVLSGGGALQRAQAQSGRGGSDGSGSSGDPRLNPSGGYWEVKMEHHWMKHGDHMDNSSSPPIVAADTSSDTDSPPPFPLPSSLGSSRSYVTQFGGSRVYGNALTAYINADGSSTYLFTWHPHTLADGTPDPNNPPPDRLCFYAQVRASAHADSIEGTWLTAFAFTGVDGEIHSGPKDDPTSQDYGQSSLVLVQLDNSARSSTLPWTPPKWHAEASAKSHPDTSIYSSRWATANVGYSLDIAQTTRYVWISSDIDQSYYKGTVAPTPVPVATGTPPVPTATPFATPTPVPSATPVTWPLVWKLPNTPNNDGSMTVDSAAEWIDLADYGFTSDNSNNLAMSNPSWWGSPGQLIAHPAGVLQPSYTWRLQGGSVVNPFDDSEAVILPDPVKELQKDAAEIVIRSDWYTLEETLNLGPGKRAGTYGLTLGGNGQGQGMTSSSTFTVSVLDKDPSMPSTPLVNTYTVRWHVPFEWKTDPQRAGFSGYTWDTNASNWTHADAIHNLTITENPPNVFWSFVSNAGALALSGSSVYVGSSGGMLGLTTPQTAGLALLLYAGGLTVGHVAPQPQQDTPPKPISYSMWDSAVKDQKRKNDNLAAGIPDKSVDRLIGFTPKEAGEAYQGLNSTFPAQDKFWDNGLQVKCDIAYSFTQSFHIGDEYDFHGFVQPFVPGDLRVQKNSYPVYLFRVEGRDNTALTPQADQTPPGVTQ